jgi:predicted translation initiation factor SUI1
MARQQKAVLFIDAGSGERGRAAEAEFNATAARLGLPWVARTSSTSGPADVAIGFEPTAGVEVWDVPTGPELNAAISREVSKLIARLLGGRVVADEPKPAAPVKEPPKKVHTVRVGRETAGRRGKGVTTVFDLPLTLGQIQELATTLKQKCGTGGTAKDGRIEIQGDHRDRIAAELEKLGYKVKRAGG